MERVRVIYNLAILWNAPVMFALLKNLLKNLSPVAAALCLIAVASLGPALADEHRLPIESVVIETASGPVQIAAEIADEPDERRQGLMFRQEIGWQEGMLFDFDKRNPVAFWMKNTYIALDMLFIDTDGTIVGITENVEPLSETTRPSPQPVIAVLELRGGAAERFGIKVGDRIRHRIFED